jgi:hypothetical protein
MSLEGHDSSDSEQKSSDDIGWERIVTESSSGNESGATGSKGERDSADPQTTSFATIGDIDEDGRIDKQLAVKVVNMSEEYDNKKQSSLLVEDIYGDQCRLNIWKKHDLSISWNIGDWYLLEQARGKQWTNKHGESNRQLSSTKDLQVTHVGIEKPEKTVENTASPTGTNTETEGESNDDILDDVIEEFDDLAGLDS